MYDYYKNQGWYKKEGLLKQNSNENLLSCISQSLFSGKHTTTYKYCFLKSLLDNLYSFDDRYSIDLEIIGKTFVSIYWNMIVVYKIPQMNRYETGAKSIFEKTTEEIIKDRPYLVDVYYDSMKEEDRNEYNKKAIPEFKKNVIGAFYEDTKGMLFGFSKKDRKIWLNHKSFCFLNDNKMIIEQVNYYQWLKMVESILKSSKNSIKNLSTILECITKRNDLTNFKNELYKYGNYEKCFYCGRKLNKNAHLDHVIPWSFLKNDNLWNLVFSCSTCNESKSNSVPDNEYLERLEERNKICGIDSPDIKRIVDSAIKNGVKSGWKPKRQKHEN